MSLIVAVPKYACLVSLVQSWAVLWSLVLKGNFPVGTPSGAPFMPCLLLNLLAGNAGMALSGLAILNSCGGQSPRLFHRGGAGLACQDSLVVPAKHFGPPPPLPAVQ